MITGYKNCDEDTDYVDEVNSLSVEPDVAYFNHYVVKGAGRTNSNGWLNNRGHYLLGW